MTLTILQPKARPERAYVTAYTAVVMDDAEVVLDDSYETPSARRDAVVKLLLANCNEVPVEDVAEILAPYGGANADDALAQVTCLYADYGIDVHLGEHQIDVGPAVLYTTFTDYGDGTTLIEHYGSRNERLTELRQRAANFADGYPLEFFDHADETTCKKVIEFALTPTRGRLFIIEADRADAGETYSGYAPKD